MDDKEIILEQLRRGLANHSFKDQYDDSPSLTAANVDTIDLAGLTVDTTQTWDPYTAITINGTSMPNVYTGINTSWQFSDIDLTTPNSGKISLQGENADIEINGRSLKNILDGLEQRLGLLNCREDLEKDWHDLKELGDRYREKVKFIEEKAKVWDALKR